MDHNYYERTWPSIPSMEIWMSDDMEPLIDDGLPVWADPNNPECKTTYKYNNYGLRCDDFTLPNPEQHIVFAGSEITVPENIDLEKGWAHITYSALHPGETNFRNLAYSGCSMQRLVSNIFKYFRHFGNPDVLCVLAPDVIRKVGVIVDKNVFKTKIYNQYMDVTPPLIEHNLFAEPVDYPLTLLVYEYLQYARFLEQYCYATGIKLYWTSFDQSTNDVIKKHDFRYFFDVDLPENPDAVWNGSWHPKFAEAFLKKINEGGYGKTITN
jgi:hypothetical protein